MFNRLSCNHVSGLPENLLCILRPEDAQILPPNNAECPYEIGDKLSFFPTIYSATSGYAANSDYHQPVFVGTVVSINEAHRFYRVEYPMPGCIGHECFKF